MGVPSWHQGQDATNIFSTFPSTPTVGSLPIRDHSGAQSHPPLYFQQTTSSVLNSAIAFSLLLSVTALLLFSWVRRRRGSIYASRQFFVREEHQSEALSDTFFGWVGDLLFIERKEEQQHQPKDNKASPAPGESEKPHNDNNDVLTTPPDIPSGCRSRETLSGGNQVGFWSRLWQRLRSIDTSQQSSQLDRQKRTQEKKSGSRADKCIRIPPAVSSLFEATNSSSQRSQQDGVENEAQQAVIARIGLDHYLLIRFLKMLLSLSIIIALMAVGVLLPIYTLGQSGEDPSTSPGADLSQQTRVEMLHIGNISDNERLWATVMVTTICSAMILLWTWSELMMFLKLRQEFLFRSATRYSSRVVLLQHLPPELRSVSALKKLFAAAPGGGVEYVYLVRDTTALEKAVKQRQVVLDRLEETESRYLDAIARASAMVSTTTLSMRSRSWIGRSVDHVKACFGSGISVAGMGKDVDDEDYVGPLKMYQLGDMLPKLSLSDLSSPTTATPGDARDGSGHTADGNVINPGGTSNVSSSSGLAVLKWYQKPRRPRHYVGLPLLSKRQDSIRYYRGELCRLNKEIAQAHEEQVRAMAADMQGSTSVGAGQSSRLLEARAVARSLISDTPAVRDRQSGTTGSHATNSCQVDILPSAFVLMRTRAGAKAVATAALDNDQYPSVVRMLGVPPRDIEWRFLGQTQSKAMNVARRIAVLGAGFLLCIGCGIAVSAIASMAVFQGWKRVPEEDIDIPASAGAYLIQGVAVPLLLSFLMLTASWILNELCQYWGRISKMQTELLTQRSYFVLLMINMAVVHPIVSLARSWQASALPEANGLVEFLVHAIPSYSSYVSAYVLAFGLSLPLYHLLQLPRLWATLPAITLWSALGPLSWRKSTRSPHASRKDGRPGSTRTNSSEAPQSDQSGSSISSMSGNTAFEANFAPAPTQTPRQAFQLRQPPFLHLQSVYPHAGVVFALSLATVPMSPVLILLWIAVLMLMNICYRHLVFQVVTTKSQSGGLHYLQAIKFILFPTLACPPLLLVVYMISRQAWVQAGFATMIFLATLAMRVVVGIQFCKREESMLKRVEKYLLEPKTRLLQAKESLGQRSGSSGLRDGGTAAEPSHELTVVTALSSAGGTIADLTQLSPHGSEGAVPESPSLMSDKDENETVDPQEYGSNEGLPRVGRRRVKRMMQRPTTIIGQVRSSFVSSISAGGPRPKSSVFDLDRYEKEIVGIGFAHEDKPKQCENLADSEGWQTSTGDEHPGGRANSVSFPPGVDPARENLHSRNSSIARAYTAATGSSPSFGEGYGMSDLVDGLFTGDGGRRATVTHSVLSKHEQEEEVKAAKYREIVKALRRASSVASRKMPELMASTGKSDQRRVRVAGAPTFTCNGLESVTEASETGETVHVSRRVPQNPTSASIKAQNRVSLPAPLNHPHSPHGSNPYLVRQHNHHGLSTGLATSEMFGRGAPSLPMLLIHRENAVIAKENSWIQGLYLNPVLHEAKAKVVVWLPSQTELSFMGASAREGTMFGQCRYHSSKAGVPAASTAATQFGSDSSLPSPVLGAEAEAENSSSHGPSTFSQSTSTLAVDTRRVHQSPRTSRYPCTCHLYQEVMKAVADAVALADQEIRDLRIVGLTVWLDSRHVVWGEENEEDGRLGDRVMISTGPATLSGDGYESACATATAASFSPLASPSIGYDGGVQKHVGDGLLSWLEVSEDGNEPHCPGQGATGIIGGSMGVIMKRPIGCYGKLAGDGEEDDISRGLD
ncbi:hypothetical protein BGX28_002465 [Mortierella sp. GBA30]|nr:hypothetical protein BGX28_002465 [Mortierella sp. GBA30]